MSSGGATRTIALWLEYDGTGFAGFQVQPGQPTVQGELERAIRETVGAAIRIAGAGRTDAGVHAVGQVASFTTESRLTPDRWVGALNARLPASIVVRQARAMPAGFHARFSATGRAYRYTIVNRAESVAIGRQYRWHVRAELDVAAIGDALARLIGRHDFAAFAGASGDHDDARTERTILQASCTRAGEDVAIDITADAFLPHMVRTIVGTLVPIGRGLRPSTSIQSILAARQRSLAGATAPPHGLCLMKVHYGGPPSL